MQSIELVGRVRRVRKKRHLCECGCGSETALADRTWARYGMVKGEPLRFVKGHNGKGNGADLSGKVFGRLTVTALQGVSSGKHRLWSCTCSCGRETIVHASALTSGHTKSCGCLREDGNNRRHGMSSRGREHPVWLAWVGMLQRCTDTNATNYKDYGGRGIKVCHRWCTFENFRDDMLPSWFSGGTLEREDNEGDYTPKNCKWATKKEQARNRRTTTWVEVFGERMSFAEAVERFGVVKYGIARQRVYGNGWSIEDALVTP